MLRVLAPGALAVWLLAPLSPLLLWALATRWSAPASLPQEWGWHGWSVAFEDGAASAAGRSLLIGFLVATLATPLGAAAGRALAWSQLRHPAPVLVVLLAPVALPPFAVSMGLDTLLLRLRVPDLAGVIVILTVFALPYTTYTMRATYQLIDREVEDQARVLGASLRQSRRLVTWPIARAGLVTATALAFLVGWSDYIVTLVVGGGQVVSLPLLIGSAASGVGNEPTLAALSLISLVPVILLVALGSLTRDQPGGARG
jgi:putative spermidine/putrescine transport system permease protein